MIKSSNQTHFDNVPNDYFGIFNDGFIDCLLNQDTYNMFWDYEKGGIYATPNHEGNQSNRTCSADSLAVNEQGAIV